MSAWFRVGGRSSGEAGVNYSGAVMGFFPKRKKGGARTSSLDHHRPEGWWDSFSEATLQMFCLTVLSFVDGLMGLLRRCWLLKCRVS